MATIRIERTHYSPGYIIVYTTGDCFKDATGVGLDHDGRKALAQAWRDLAINTGHTVAALKALPREKPRLRIPQGYNAAHSRASYVKPESDQ